MRTLKFAILTVLVIALAMLLAINWEPQATYKTSGGQSSEALETLSDELRIDQLILSFDPLGALPDWSLTFLVKTPVLVMMAAIIGLLLGLVLENIRSRRMRLQLREVKDEAAIARSELERVKRVLKEVDHPSSASPPARR